MKLYDICIYLNMAFVDKPQGMCVCLFISNVCEYLIISNFCRNLNISKLRKSHQMPT